MRGLKMAELKFEAPLATFETEDWNDFNDYQTATELDNSSKDSIMAGLAEKTDNPVPENFGETFSGSLEDLVNTFDEKITKCFCNFEEKVEKFAPVQIRTQEEIMNDCHMWWTITGNFGNLLPIDWSKTYARQLQSKALNLRERTETASPQLDLSDDEELSQAFDMHSLIIHSLQPDHDEPMESADDVINEIEILMMQHEAHLEDAFDAETFEQTITKTKVRETFVNLPVYMEEELKALSLSSLNELLNELEFIIKNLSEILIQELALRDELEYDKELKNQFISLLLTIQKRQREYNLERKRKRGKFSNNVSEAGNTYLTTVIPYHPHQGPPDSEQLQIYIKILQAINEDSSTVPGLLTDYILKVLCPT